MKKYKIKIEAKYSAIKTLNAVFISYPKKVSETAPSFALIINVITAKNKINTSDLYINFIFLQKTKSYLRIYGCRYQLIYFFDCGFEWGQNINGRLIDPLYTKHYILRHFVIDIILRCYEGTQLVCCPLKKL